MLAAFQSDAKVLLLLPSHSIVSSETSEHNAKSGPVVSDKVKVAEVDAMFPQSSATV